LASIFFDNRAMNAAHPHPAAAHVDFVHASKIECYLGSRRMPGGTGLPAILHDAMQLITDVKDA
jgi:hypothetical protein